MCTQGIEPQVNVLVAAVYLGNVLDYAGALGRHCGDQEGDTGADVGG